jgi:hypothetical protein
MTDYQKAQWIPNSNFFPDTGKKTHVVIHGTAGGSSAEEIAHFFQGTEGTDSPVSTHYIVDQQGIVVQTVLEKDGSFGQGVDDQPEFHGTLPNNWCIGIEHVKSTNDNSASLTPIQEQTSFALIKDIITRNSIPVDNIIPHNRITKTSCPGPYPFDAMRAFLEGPMPKPVVTKPGKYQLEAALNEWNSVSTTPTGTGIYEQWLADYINGVFHGPPVAHERNDVDWEGNPIVKQQFLYHHVEWSNGLLGWFDSKGKIE